LISRFFLISQKEELLNWKTDTWQYYNQKKSYSAEILANFILIRKYQSRGRLEVTFKEEGGQSSLCVFPKSPPSWNTASLSLNRRRNSYRNVICDVIINARVTEILLSKL